MKRTKTEVRLARCAERMSAVAEAGGGEGFVTRRGLAAVLKVSVRTVDEMVAAKEITPVRPHGPLVRFYLPHVVRELTAAAVARLRGQMVISDQSSVIGQQGQEASGKGAE
jgi:hypothetical protein